MKEPQAWQEECHRRSRVGAFRSSLRARNPQKVRKQVVHAQVVEATLKATVLRALDGGAGPGTGWVRVRESCGVTGIIFSRSLPGAGLYEKVPVGSMGA